MTLCDAARRGDLAEVRRLLAAGADLEEDEHGDRPLVIACAEGHDEIAEVLLAAGADALHADDSGMRPIEWAVARPGKLHHAEAIAGRGGLPRRPGVEEDEGLDELEEIEWHHLARAAAGSGEPAHVAWIVAQTGVAADHELAIAMRSDALQVAAGRALRRVIDDLLARAPTAAAMHIAVHAALGGNHVALALELADRAGIAEQLPTDSDALIHALWSKQLDGVQMLLDRGADPDALGTLRRCTPLEAAIGDGFVDAVTLLLDRGAKLTPGMVVAAADRGSEVLRLVIARGGDVDDRASSGRTAIMAAIRRRAIDDVGLLMAHGAAVDRKDDRGWTELTHARNLEPPVPELVRMLRAAGARDRGPPTDVTDDRLVQRLSVWTLVVIAVVFLLLWLMWRTL